ncbi:hypothetical protein, partial [Xenorhabdus mauleonii]
IGHSAFSFGEKDAYYSNWPPFLEIALIRRIQEYNYYFQFNLCLSLNNDEIGRKIMADIVMRIFSPNSMRARISKIINKFRSA